jgi:type IV pilus assembly protein PilX
MFMTFSYSRHRADRLPRVLRRQGQRGVTLMFALITLVALLFATLALVRSVDTSTILMGNIGFKQDATVTADQATKNALNWLSTHGTVLNSDSLGLGLGQGYYASTQEFDSTGKALNPVDVTGQQISGVNRNIVDWSNDNCSTSGTNPPCSVAVPAANISGPNSARYIIFRLCSQPGDYASSGYTGSCAMPLSTNTDGNGNKGLVNYKGGLRPNTAAGPYYRIVVRVQGARSTTSFTETIVHF